MGEVGVFGVGAAGRRRQGTARWLPQMGEALPRRGRRHVLVGGHGVRMGEDKIHEQERLIGGVRFTVANVHKSIFMWRGPRTQLFSLDPKL